MPALPNLWTISITFNTHSEDDKDHDTVLSVFVKNRSSDTSFSENSSDFISNHMAYEQCDSAGIYDVNPYLARLENVSPGDGFGNGSSHSFNLELRTAPIPCGEIVLPVVDIHILPNGNDTWVFDYTVMFYFAEPGNQSDPNHVYDFGFFSNANGVTGIILDQDNRNYSGLGTENPHAISTTFASPSIDSLLTEVRLDFYTHNDDKDNDTQVDVHIVNRVNATVNQDIAIATNILAGQSFGTGSLNSITFSAGTLPLISTTFPLQNVVLPVVNIFITPSGDDTWIFDYKVTFFFSYKDTPVALSYSSTTTGIILDQNERKHSGAYRGDSFPATAPVGADVTQVDPSHPPKGIFFSLLKKKLDLIINNRQGQDPASPDAAFVKFRLDSAEGFGIAYPANYYELKSIQAAPPIPGTITDAGYVEPVTWSSSPSDLGALSFFDLAGIYLQDINSSAITLTADASQPAPLTLKVSFETGGPTEITGTLSVDIIQFSITISLTLTLDPDKHRVDLMSWIGELSTRRNLAFRTLPPVGSAPPQIEMTGTFLGQPVNVIASDEDTAVTTLLEQVLHVELTTSEVSDPGGTLRQMLRDKIFSTLTNTDNFTGESLQDSVNASANSWLLGGITEKGVGVVPASNICTVQGVTVDPAAGQATFQYNGPEYALQDPAPPGWPPAGAFDPGTLAQIDHIVVLLMENRSFDHMLGYLSLPVTAGGMGRTEVDGLKGGEVNYLIDGMACYSKPFATEETVFAPDPPHSFAPVQRAINAGKMDGFAAAYAQNSGPEVGPNIMKFHTGANLPTYDALARDFAIGHRWFAAHPGPTFCNRYHQTTGRLNIDPYGFWELSNSSKYLPVFTPTIFDHLADAQVSWKYFEHNYCFLRFFEKYTFDNTNVADYDDPEFGFVNLARTGNLPSVTFIDPRFIELPPGGNCDGPPADVRQGQLLVQEVVEAVVSSPTWSNTLLLVTYDEHGGFYDHVPPPPAVQIAPGLPDTYGVRVPVFVISPWVAAGSVFGHDAQTTATGTEPSLYFDHTSILRTIAKRFLPPLPKYYMGPREAAANDLSSIVIGAPRSGPFLPFVRYKIQYARSLMS